ncbi:hypothetical protein GCM10010123_44160 [Pilimelia anulata]|uniref:Uncharacterized protein n=1 Tax=Pilimelia anulata TaxID=53371 RepID=A0A8J3BB80_9ACTN|nr:hypothetical protein [Pilimelia anulata]GGK09447.1 hypothetical protein GCM10010123_44160 [Pilimelia anulata]
MRQLAALALAAAGCLAAVPAPAAAAATPGAGTGVLGSRTGIAASRAGTTVTVAGTVTRYAPAAGRYVAWSGVGVTILTRSRPTAPWRALTRVRTDAAGRVPARSWHFSRTTYLRLEVLPTDGVWGSAAARRV